MGYLGKFLIPDTILGRNSSMFSAVGVKALLRAGLCSASLFAAVPQAAQAQGDDSVDQGSGYGEIVVTAQRDASLASKTPLAISAISGDDLLNAGVTNPLQLESQVPNLQLNRYYGLQITIRGVSNTDTTAKGDPSAAFLLDGVYIARPQAQEVSFFDIDRVEVLRGPQGTLYGRNSTAGVINVISRRPDDEFEVTGSAGYGNYNTFQAEAALNLPVSDRVGVRLSGSLDRRDTYIEREPTDPYSGDNPFKDTKSVRLSTKFDLSDDLSLLLVGDYSSMRGITQFNVDGSNFFAPVNGDTSNRVYVEGLSAKERLRRGFNQQLDPKVDNDVYGVMGELSWNLGPVTATYLGSYRRLNIDEATTDLLGQVSPTYSTQTYNQSAHEFRLALNDVERLKLQAGVTYFEEDSVQYFDQPGFFGFDHFILDYGPTKAKSLGVFGQGTYSLTDSFRLTAGLRYTKDEKSQVGDTILKIDGLPDTVLVGGADVEFSKLTWRVAADYDLNSTNMLYGSVATGYKAGGFNDGCLDGSVIGGVPCNSPRSPEQLFYAPETITSYELGLKGRTDNNQLRYTLTGFYYDYGNLQLSGTTFYNGAAAQLIQNAGKARVMGIEADLAYRPFPRHEFTVLAAYLDAEYTSYQPLGPTGPDFAGRPLDRSPKLGLTAGYTHTVPFASGASLQLGVRSKYSSSYVLSTFSQALQFRQPGYTRTELSATYNAPDDRWYAQAYARNLENEVLATAMTNIAGTMAVVPSDPRTYGVRVGFKF